MAEYDRKYPDDHGIMPERCTDLNLLNFASCDQETADMLAEFITNDCVPREADRIDYIMLEQQEGAGMIFDAEITHGVSTLTEGVRTVFVMEFWELADASSDECRPGSEDGTQMPEMPAEPPEGCDRNGGVYQHGCWV
jgi:hypothetical protein